MGPPAAMHAESTRQSRASALRVQAFVGGKTLTDVVDRVFAGAPLAGTVERVTGIALAAG